MGINENDNENDNVKHCVNCVKGFTQGLHNLFCIKANKINSLEEICGPGLQVYTIFIFLSHQ